MIYRLFVTLVIMMPIIGLDMVEAEGLAQSTPGLESAAQDAAQRTKKALPAGTIAGNQALELWNAEGQRNAPLWVQYWLWVMQLSFALGLLFIWKKTEARMAVGGFIAVIIGVVYGLDMFGLQPLSGYFALLHLICWTPALYFLLKNKPWKAVALGMYDKAYKGWTVLMTFVICFSFIFDIRDAAIYLDYMLGIGILS